MKRSEMVKLIEEELENNQLKYGELKFVAEHVLDICLLAGMRPPAVQKLHKPSGDIELYYKWEPEDE